LVGNSKSQNPNPKSQITTAASWDLGFGIWVLGFVLASLAITACGKKGPPLAPIIHVPAAVDKVAAQRIGNDIYLALTIPTQNIDASTPADVARIDVFGVTSQTPPPRTRFFDVATKVASIDVQPAVRPDPSPTVSAPPSPLPAQGATVTLRDALTPADLVPKELPAAAPRGTTPPTTTVTTPPPSAFPHRYYIAVAISDRGRNGPPGALVDVPMPPLPDPPAGLSGSYTEDAITISWEPSGGVLGFLLEKPVALESAPVDENPDAPPPPTESAPVGPVMYNVYRETPPNAPAAAAPASPAVPAPVNAVPLTAYTYSDTTPFDFGQPRCYSVRAVRGTAPNVVVSEPSERLCITPDDTFPPMAPTALTSIAADGVISLLWEPNGEADLDGYLVLRGRLGDATLQPLTQMPVKDVRYEDHDVMPGVRYVYAVQAVDNHTPTPNVSGESNRVEETAR
jgi:hypothetical protein